MKALDVEREPDRGQRPAERPEQLVIPTAGADRHPVGGIVDLEHGAGVIAEAAHQAEIEDHPRRHLRRQQRVNVSHPTERIVHPAGESVEHLRSTAGTRQSQQQLGVRAGEAEAPDLPSEADEIARRELGQDSLLELRAHTDRLQQRRVQR